MPKLLRVRALQLPDLRRDRLLLQAHRSLPPVYSNTTRVCYMQAYYFQFPAYYLRDWIAFLLYLSLCLLDFMDFIIWY